MRSSRKKYEKSNRWLGCWYLKSLKDDVHWAHTFAYINDRWMINDPAFYHYDGTMNFYSSEHFPVVVIETWRGHDRHERKGRWLKIIHPSFVQDPKYTFWSDAMRWTSSWKR